MDKATIKVCWDAIDERIVSGPLPGNGLDKTAERNGLIIASNILADLLGPELGGVRQRAEKQESAMHKDVFNHG